MKKIIILLVISITPNISFAVTFSDGFGSMNCTDAITWAAAQIASPPPPNFTQKEWSKFLRNGGAETISIQILSTLPGSPCFKSLSDKYGFGPQGQTEKR